ncbi:MAG: peptidoglycan editing factor PgeF [Proteobacteria bacterium]|nr:peptidoglycan editing factor PgeF [Pseudomonadota bacterium]
MLTLGPLNAIEGVRHAFFNRDGGVSQGLYASLNCGLGSDDALDNVITNRTRAAMQLDVEPGRLVTLYQVHGTKVLEVVAPWPRDALPRADAMVTTNPGVALGILTADCAPVLFADGAARIVGAAHAGWRGALAGVIGATVEAMIARGADAKRMVAGIGPCIAQRSYEVGPEFPAPFLAADPDNEAFFAPAPRDRHYLFDLRGYVARQLAQLGIKHIFEAPHDTVSDERFFSYRRSCLRGERDYGRALSAIALE